MTRRYFALDLQNDPAVIAEYERWHTAGRIWPEVLETLVSAGVVELEIHRSGDRLVMTVELPEGGGNDGAASGAQIPQVPEWENLMSTFQQPLPWAAPGQKWVPMERIFSMRDVLRTARQNG